MTPADFDLELAKLAPGVAGAAISMRQWPGTWPEKITMGASGIIISYFLTDWVANKTGLPSGPTGFLLGLFGMMIVGKLWEMIAALDAKQMAIDVWGWIKNRAGA